MKLHHKIYKKAKVSSVYFEELLYNSFVDESFRPIWKCESKNPGTDITVNDVKISCKGGKINKNDRSAYLTFSGCRTTSSETIEEKIVSVQDTEDVIISLAVTKLTPEYVDYELNVIPAENINYDSLKWEEVYDKKKRDPNTGKNKLIGWIGTGEFEARITKNMSDQLWTTIPAKFIAATYTYTFDLVEYEKLDFMVL